MSRRERGFTVTAKGRTGRERARVGLPRLHTVLVAVSIASAAWFVATSAGLTPMRYDIPWAANGSALWLAVNSLLLTVAVRRIRQERYGVERRAAMRFPVEGYALVDGVPRAAARRLADRLSRGRPGSSRRDKVRSAVSGALPDAVRGSGCRRAPPA